MGLNAFEALLLLLLTKDQKRVTELIGGDVHFCLSCTYTPSPYSLSVLPIAYTASRSAV